MHAAATKYAVASIGFLPSISAMLFRKNKAGISIRLPTMNVVYILPPRKSVFIAIP